MTNFKLQVGDLIAYSRSAGLVVLDEFPFCVVKWFAGNLARESKNSWYRTEWIESWLSDGSWVKLT